MRGILSAVVAALVLAPSAFAQGGGVTVDPDSPSGHEYEIPLESARRGAEPNTDPGAPVRQGQTGAPLFGAGIAPVKTSTPKSSSHAQSQSRSFGTSKPEIKSTAKPAPVAVRVAATTPGAPDGGTGSTLLYVGGGLVVLALGAGAGALLRRRG